MLRLVLRVCKFWVGLQWAVLVLAEAMESCDNFVKPKTNSKKTVLNKYCAPYRNPTKTGAHYRHPSSIILNMRTNHKALPTPPSVALLLGLALLATWGSTNMAMGQHQSPGKGPCVLVHASIYQSNPWVPICDPQPCGYGSNPNPVPPANIPIPTTMGGAPIQKWYHWF